MRRRRIWLLLPLLGACAAPAPFIHPLVVGRPPAEVSRLVAASEARLFPCSIAAVQGEGAIEIKGRHPEVALPPGRYLVTLECSSGSHTAKPKVALSALRGKRYKLTGYLVDDSITIFNMRMRARVDELLP